jgi:hypothetical protein
MKIWKHLVYTGLALGMLAFAVPKLAIGGGLTAESIFGAVWICFALLIVAANLHTVLGVDTETRERMRHVKRMRSFQSERKIYSRASKLGRQL